MFSWGSLFTEFSARRRRLDKALGDRGKGLFELFVLGGLILGSAGLFLYPWMFSAAWWGLAAPVLFLALYVFIDVRRQRAVAAGGEEKTVRKRHQYLTLWATLGCVALGYCAFTIGLLSDPRPAPEPAGWQPPRDAIPTEIITPE